MRRKASTVCPSGCEPSTERRQDHDRPDPARDITLAAAAYPLDRFTRLQDYAGKLTGWVEDAVAGGADLMVFPEYAAMELAALGGEGVGADVEASMREVARHAEAIGAVLDGLARRHQVTILGGSAPVWPAQGARPVNRAILYGPQGVIGHQDKQIMTRFERELADVVPGRDGLAVLQTPAGPVGTIICYDSEFPLLARRLVDDGAAVLLVPSVTEGEAGFYRVRVGAQARALENQCVVVHAPVVGDADWCELIGRGTGRAAIYGPPDLGFPPSGILAEGGMNSPGWTFATIPAGAISRVRAEGTVFNHAHWPEQAQRLG